MDPLHLLITNITLCFIATMSGIALNSWIIRVNLRDWRRGVRLSTCDRIISFMGLINALMQIVFSVYMFLSQILDSTMVNKIQPYLYLLLLFLVPYNMWLTAFLSTIYCLKIVNFTRGLFLSLKLRISQFLPNLLLASAVYCTFVALPSLWNFCFLDIPEHMGNSSNNSTIATATLAVVWLPYMITTALGCLLPLLLTLIPISVTLTSLWRHIWRIKMKNSDSCRPQTQAHVTASRTMLLLVTLHTTFHVSCLTIMLRTFKLIPYPVYFCWYFLMFYSSVQSIIIITSNSKLWRASKRLLFNHDIKSKEVATAQNA